ncbi:MAG: hypothetical protein ACRDZY_02045, partial [Acidimicrobiales bacterium]
MTDVAPSTPSPSDPDPGGRRAVHDVTHAVAALRDQLGHLEQLVGSETASAGGGTPRPRPSLPGWLRPNAGEERWPVASAVVLAILLQVALPERLTIGPGWVLPALEGALVVGLTAANPRRIDRRSRALRGASVALIALTSLANGWSSYTLIKEIIHGQAAKNAGALLATGASSYLTNIL